MSNETIQNELYEYILSKGVFDAPYGVLLSDHVSKKGFKSKAITFGRARTLDATIEIYNRKYFILKASRFNQNKVLFSVADIKAEIDTL